MKTKKVLILTAPYGSGHHQVAKVLTEEFAKQGVETVEIDYFKEYEKMIVGPTVWLYNNCFSPGWSQFYYFCYKLVDIFFWEWFWNFYAKKHKKFRKMVDTGEFDAIINTFPIAAAYSYTRDRDFENMYTVVTDFSVHKKWIDKNNKRYFVGEDILFDYFATRRPEEIPKLAVTGIPIREQFYKKYNKKRLRKELGIPDENLVCNVLLGAAGVYPELVGWVISQAKRKAKINFIVMCGKNSDALKRLNDQKLDNLFAVGYVNNVAEYYAVSDVVITKPGGITLSELMQTKTPTIIYKPLQGQEENNALFFESANIAFVAKNLPALSDKIRVVYQHPDILNTIKNNLNKFHKENAAKKIVDIVVKDIEDFNR